MPTEKIPLVSVIIPMYIAENLDTFVGFVIWQ